MTSRTPSPSPPPDPNAPLVNPQAVYIKDCSFEAPTGPFVGGLEGQPAVNLNICDPRRPRSRRTCTKSCCR